MKLDAQRGFAPIIFILGILIFSSLIVAGAFYAKKNYSPSQQKAEEALVNKKEGSKYPQEVERENIFSKITKNSWGCRDTPEGAPGPDFFMYSFKADGTYAIDHVTDYPIPPVTGKWNFEKETTGDWSLLFDNGQRLKLTLDGDKLSGFKACNNILKVSNPYTAETLPKIELSPQLKLAIERLTSVKWKRANDLDTDYEPTGVELKKDWEYVTTWGNGECQDGGNWSFSDKGIQGSGLTNKCDTRDNPSSSFTAELLDNGNLFFDNDLYVPENYTLNKGIIWSVFGYSAVVNIKVEYDMPIKAGVPNKFDIEMTNVGKNKYPGAKTLQRFSLTEGYFRDYRIDQNTIAQVKEIAGKDLGSKVLQPDESYKFSLDVTFPKPGKQNMYINAFILDKTQTWDTHQVYSINVQ